MIDFLRAARSRLEPRWLAFTEPRATGLPNWRVMAWFPALLTLIAIPLVALRISGTSSGSYFTLFGTGTDPQLLAGTPRLVRSDEWLVNQGWAVSQSQTGYRPFNPTFPGGMDTTVLQDLPSTDWSMLLRPQDWGFAFGIEVGVAWQWWVPALAFLIAAYLLIVTFVPRRPISAAIVPVAVILAPSFQWTWGPSILYPVAWAFLVMAGIRWITRDERRWVAWLWAVPIASLTVAMTLALYLPFIIPCFVPVIAFAIGTIAEWRKSTGLTLRRLFVRAIPLFVAAGAAVVAVGAWAATRSATIAAIGSTVYPGFRSVPSGTLLENDFLLAGTAGSVFSQSLLTETIGTVLGSSAPAAASVPLFAAFVAPGLILLVIARYRRDRRIDWISVCSVAALAFVVIYLLVPGLDLIGKLLLFDRVPAIRFRILLAVLIPLFFALVVRHVDRQPNRWVSWPSIIAGGLAVASTGWVLFVILRKSPELLAAGPLWPLVAILFTGSVFLVFVRRLVWLSGTLLLAMGLIVGAGVNPVYQGIFDLNRTEIGAAIDKANDAEPGRWVGIGGFEVMGLLMQSGAQGYSGLQTYPPEEMWQQIDPTGQYDENWNRLAHVRWNWGPGDPVVQLYQADVIVTTFDPCSDFAQENVGFVASTIDPPDEACLAEVETVTEGATTLTIWAVTPKS